MKRILLLTKNNKKIIVERSLKTINNQIKMLWVLLPFCMISNVLAQGWIIDPSPNPRTNNRLNAVVAISSSDAWAVGYYFNYAATPDQTLALHWNGTTWSQVASPNVSNNGYLNGIAAVASNDIWAVGYVDISSGIRYPLIEHWNGVEWSIVPSPDPGAYVTTLSAVTAVSANDVWAAGWFSNDGGATYQTLIMHWDGSIWSVVPSPNPSYYQHLNGISAGSANDIWTVGHYTTAVFGEFLTLIEHWNGTSWSIVSSVDPGAASNSLYAIAVLPSGEAWAVGRSYELFNDSHPWQTLVEHRYSVVPVELTSFTANTNGDDVIINWSTATELNNSGFEVLRKKTVDRSQESDWEKIGFVPGFGTTAEQKNYSFSNENLSAGVYNYRLKQVDFDGSFGYSDIVEVEVNNIPAQFSLEQNYPNPFNPATNFEFHIANSGFVNLKIFDVLGNEVETLVNEEKEPGSYKIEYNSSHLASGVYYYRLTANGFTDTKKFILLK